MLDKFNKKTGLSEVKETKKTFILLQITVCRRLSVMLLSDPLSNTKGFYPDDASILFKDILATGFICQLQILLFYWAKMPQIVCFHNHNSVI